MCWPGIVSPRIDILKESGFGREAPNVRSQANGANEAPHETVLVKAHIEHRGGADGRNPESDETISGHR
jgi:hypothetical protein